MKCSQMTHPHISRRDFLMVTGMSSALLMLCSAINCDRVWGTPVEDYYRLNKAKFMTSFDKTAHSANVYLSGKFDHSVAEKICTAAQKEFEQLLPEIPYIGGDRHPGTKWMLLAAQWVAFMRPMQEAGYAEETSARMMYDLYVEYLHTIPKETMRKRGQYIFSEKHINGMKQWAKKSKTQRVDWVADFIPGDGKEFDYGIDYSYCPCFAYFASQNAKPIAPYFCLVDFPEHKIMETGLVRKKTLAQGADICDFRYKKGRSVTQNWTTEVPKFPQNS